MTTTPVVLALTAAVGYGTGDFLGGQGSRRTSPQQLSVIVQCTGLLVAAVAVAITAHGSPSAHVLLWGCVCGVGSALGVQARYRGLASGAMNVVAPLSAVLTAALPAIVGLADGERMRTPALIGLLVAVPSIALISMAPAVPKAGTPRSATPRRPFARPGARRVRLGVGWGLLAGCGFGLLFVGLDKAGTGSGAWPLLLGQIVAVTLGAVTRAALRPAGQRSHPGSWSHAVPWGVSSGLSGAVGNITFFLAAGSGPLTLVAVLGALYPAVTVTLAAVFLHERAGPTQIIGLLLAAGAVVLITIA